jgi:hypothetical protein
MFRLREGRSRIAIEKKNHKGEVRL